MFYSGRRGPSVRSRSRYVLMVSGDEYARSLSMRRAVVQCKEKFSFSEKLGRLRVRMQDPEWRRYFKLIMAGKAIGLLLMVVLIVTLPAIIHGLSGTPAFGQATSAPSAVM